MKQYTIVVTNNDEDTSTSDIIDIIEELDGVLDTEVLYEDDNGVRLTVEVEDDFDYDLLEGTIDSYLGLSCEFIDGMMINV